MTKVFDASEVRASFLDAITKRVADGIQCHVAFLVGPIGELTILELSGLDGQQQRKTIQQMVIKVSPVLVLHACEIWFTDLEKDDPRLAETEEAQKHNQMHALSWVKEGVYLFAESVAGSLTIERATILRSPDNAATLSGWERGMIGTAPRPTWRRYFPESTTAVGSSN